MGWYDVDRKGLAKLIESRGRSFIVLELVQNAWDEDGVTTCSITLEPDGNGIAKLIVEDDAPDGFKDITHSFTLFAESGKKSNPAKRGRFNRGEKIVLALCKEASIKTTTGTVIFTEDDKRKRGRAKTKKGSIFQARVRMTKADIDECQASVMQLFPPNHITTTFNGEVVPIKSALHRFDVVLPTLISDEQGILRPTRRKTFVEVYDTVNGEPAQIYEMGIPVCETNDRWHVNVLQKVPLSMERDNVTPSYLRKLRVHVLNEMWDEVEQEDAATWARDAITDKDATDDAIDRSIELRFGEKRVAYDPSDQEANQRAASKGYTVVHGRSLSKGEWEAVKRAEAILPAGQVMPTPKPYSDHGDPVEIIPREDWTDKQRFTCEYAEYIGRKLIGEPVIVSIVKLPNWSAVYKNGGLLGDRRLDLSIKGLGKSFFNSVAEGDVTIMERFHQLLIHEFAHEFESNHLAANYHEQCCRLGAKLTRLALEGELGRISVRNTNG